MSPRELSATRKATWSLPALLVLLGSLVAVSTYSFAVFHTIAEGFTLLIAVSAFVITYNVRHLVDNDLMVFIGIGLLGYAALGVPHVLAYPGVELLPGFGFDLVQQTYLAQRVLLAFTLLLAPLFLKRRLRLVHTFTILGTVGVFALLSMLAWRIFPTMWTPGQGFTPLRQAFEYVLVAGLAVLIVVASRNPAGIHASVARMQVAALVCAMLAGAVLVPHHGPTDTSALVGHLLTVAAFYFGYRAVVAVGLVEPYGLLFRENVRRESALTEANASLNAVAAISDIAISALDLEQLLPAVLARLLDMMNADAAAVLIPDGNRMKRVASLGFDDAGFSVPMGMGISGTIAQTRETLYVADVQESPTMPNAPLRAAGIRTVQGVPLLVDKTLVGVLHVDWREVRHYSEDDARLLGIVADRVALAMSNAQRFESERRIAEVLQESLLQLPSQLEGIEFARTYDSATVDARVGGDFFDLFEIDADTIGVLIGDVSGKGVEAAVLTSLVKDTVRAHAHEGHRSPAQVLALTNAVVEHYSREETFVTVLFCMLDRHGGLLRYCNAGHPAGVVAHADGRLEQLPARSPLLGAFREVRFEDDETRLVAGDTLLFYTDGVIEARGAAGEMFGEAQLLASLASGPRDPHEMVLSLRKALLRFTSGGLADDMAVLAVRFLGDPPL